MKRKYILVNIVASAVLLALVSWGYVGHQVVAKVAENHLSPQAKAAVHALLGAESITEIASWADEARNEPEYKATASWHFLNLPLGLDRADFEKAVRGQNKENVYSAILAQEKVLSDNSASREQKVTALKFLVHFAGDAHQPMHISRAEDKGGNTVQVQFEGRGTNLHSLWDSRLIDKEGLGYSELATKIDQASPALIKQAANTDPMQWVWESYQVSSKLYPEVEKSNKLGEDYYQGHIAVVNERLELGGLRLAEVLNALFKNAVIPAASASSAAKSPALSPAPGKAESQMAEAKTAAVNIDVKDAASHLGQMVTLSAKAFGHRDMQSFVLVNLGAEYPNQLVTLLLRSKVKDLAGNMDGKTVTVTGKLIDFKGKPEIEVREAADISVK